MQTDMLNVTDLKWWAADEAGPFALDFYSALQRGNPIVFFLLRDPVQHKACVVFYPLDFTPASMEKAVEAWYHLTKIVRREVERIYSGSRPYNASL